MSQIRVRGSEPVTGNPIPNGTQVSVRIVTDTGVLTLAPVVLVGGIATFNVTVPTGVGTIQASAVLRSP